MSYVDIALGADEFLRFAVIAGLNACLLGLDAWQHETGTKK